MGYSIRHAGKSERMSPEEEQVFDALQSYTFEPEDTTPRDFTPTYVLYDTYLRYVNKFDYSAGESAAILNDKEFGVALRRVFDIDASRKTRRTYLGKNLHGYIHVRGPDSIISNDVRGNPRNRRVKRAADPKAA